TLRNNRDQRLFARGAADNWRRWRSPANSSPRAEFPASREKYGEFPRIQAFRLGIRDRFGTWFRPLTREFSVPCSADRSSMPHDREGPFCNDRQPVWLCADVGLVGTEG